MFDKRGSTLIESLFAFEIYITVIILFVSLFMTLDLNEIKLKDYYTCLLKKEEEIFYQDDFQEIIKMVLHS